MYLFGFFSLCNIPLQEDILRGIFARFFQQANMIVYIFVALGISIFEKLILWIVFVIAKQRIDRIIVQLSLFVIFMSVFCFHVQVSHPEYLHFTPTTEPTKSVYHIWAENVLHPLPNDSILLLFGDLETNIMHYYQYRWNIRPDVQLISVNHLSYSWWDEGVYKKLYPNCNFPGKNLAISCTKNIDKGENYPYSMNEFIKANFHRPIFSLLKWPSLSNCYVNDKETSENVLYQDKYSITSFGLTNKIVSR